MSDKPKRPKAVYTTVAVTFETRRRLLALGTHIIYRYTLGEIDLPDGITVNVRAIPVDWLVNHLLDLAEAEVKRKKAANKLPRERKQKRADGPTA